MQNASSVQLQKARIVFSVCIFPEKSTEAEPNVSKDQPTTMLNPKNSAAMGNAIPIRIERLFLQVDRKRYANAITKIGVSA